MMPANVFLFDGLDEQLAPSGCVALGCHIVSGGITVHALVARLRENREFLLGLLGLTLWWPLLRRPTGFYVLAGHDFSPVASRGWYTLFLGCVICLGVAILAMSPRMRIYARSRKASVIVAGVSCVQFACKLVELFMAPSGAVAVLLALIDVVFYALVFVWLTCVWAAWVLSLHSSKCALVCCISFSLSFFLRAVSSLAAGADVIVMAMFPVLSVLCALAVRDDSSIGRVDATIQCNNGSPLVAAWHVCAQSFRGVTGLLPLFLIIAAVTRAVAFGPLDGALLSPMVTPQDWLTIGLAGVVLAYCLQSGSLRGLPRFVWPLATVVLFAGLFLMSYAGAGAMGAGKQIMVVGRTILGLLFWLVLADKAHDSSDDVLAAFAVPFLLTDAVSSLLGYVVVPGVLGVIGFAELESPTLLAAAVTFALVVVSVVFFARAMDSGSGVSVSATTSSCASDVTGANEEPAPFEGYALTEREAEVARLLAEGNSQKKIAELMGVSIGTVQTHVKAVYRKLDIHSKQQLIDLVRR